MQSIQTLSQNHFISEDSFKHPLETNITHEKPLQIRPLNKKCKLLNDRVGRWSQDETILYIQFLQKNLTLFHDIQLRRNHRIFKAASQFIGYRSATQCRSHHQKMMKKYGTVKSIIDSLAPQSIIKNKLVVCGKIQNTEKSLNSLVVEQKNENSIPTSNASSIKLISDLVVFREEEQKIEIMEMDNFNLQSKSPRMFLEFGANDLLGLDEFQL